jgi:hypothetical protein
MAMRRCGKVEVGSKQSGSESRKTIGKPYTADFL